MLYNVTICGDKYIIHVDNDVTFSQVFTKEVVHHCLKCCGRVSKTKEHNLWFIKSSIRFECGFPLVTFFDSYVVVTPSHIKLCKEKRGSIWGFGRAYITFIQVFINESIETILFSWCEWVHFAIKGSWSVWQEFYHVIPRTRFRESLGFFFTEYLSKHMVFLWYLFLPRTFCFICCFNCYLCQFGCFAQISIMISNRILFVTRNEMI